MDDAAYQTHHNTLQVICNFVAMMDLEEFVRRIGQAQTLAPVLSQEDPAIFQKALDKLGTIKACAEHLIPLRKFISDNPDRFAPVEELEATLAAFEEMSDA